MKKFLLGLLAYCTTTQAFAEHYPGRSTYEAPLASGPIEIDGRAAQAWNSAQWRQMNYLWLGEQPTAEDYQGRYKVMWDQDYLYILAEFVDDVLIDRYRDPLTQYWDDDCFEIFIDEDFSGGEHQYNHNAFAYHLSLDNRAIDIGTDKQPRDYSSHVKSRWQQFEGKLIWEVRIKIYKDNYQDDSNNNAPVRLTEGTQMGLMLAYCDNDGSAIRENFMGSEDTGEHSDRGWIDAGLFGQLILVAD